jgi:hypothetical protein
VSNSTSKKIEDYIKSTRWKRRAERVRRKFERAEQTRKEVLGREPERERNPLNRRSRGRGKGSAVVA